MVMAEGGYGGSALLRVDVLQSAVSKVHKPAHAWLCAGHSQHEPAGLTPERLPTEGQAGSSRLHSPPPTRCPMVGGAARCRLNRTEALNVEVSKEALSSAIRSGWCSKGPATGHGRPQGQEGQTGSKQSRVIAMLQSPAGATIAAMMQTTGWQQHSVRGFLAGVVRKRLKLKLGSKKVDGTRVYRVATGDSGKPGARRSKRQSP
jgi:Protein of unknown function (DUF3489)